MKNLLTTLSIASVLLISSATQADEAIENYNAHANNHVGYAESHSGKITTTSQSNITNVDNKAFEHVVLPDETNYNAHAFNHVSYKDALKGKKSPQSKSSTNDMTFKHIVLPDEADYNPYEFNNVSYKDALLRTSN